MKWWIAYHIYLLACWFAGRGDADKGRFQVRRDFSRFLQRRGWKSEDRVRLLLKFIEADTDRAEKTAGPAVSGGGR